MPVASQPSSASRELAAHFAAAARLEGALANADCLWVTDADGTLWCDDIAEGFLRRLQRDRAFVAPDAQGDAWRTYEAKVAQDRAAGYAWAAQAMAGLSVDEVSARAADFAREFVPANLLPGMRALVERALERRAEIWIVTASPELVVKAAAPLVGLDPGRVIGVRVAIDGGRLTETLVPPVTFREGKVVAIRERLGRAPTLVSGDSVGDLEMLALATDAALFIRHAHTDPKVVEHARRSGWLVESLGRGE